MEVCSTLVYTQNILRTVTSQRNGCSISTSPVHLSTEALLLWLCSFAQQLVEAKNVAESDSMCFGMVDF